MSGWQVGDLALCVASGEWGSPSGDIAFGFGGPRSGQLFTVSEVVDHPSGSLGLVLKEYPGHAFAALSFRRIPPHQFDEEDLETVNLMKRAPAPAVPQ